ncbi:MAG: hypothetical protein JJW03_05245 [Desulfosarcina sp.]|nr:hypothetical protein [Desulfobacterales bacterium]
MTLNELFQKLENIKYTIVNLGDNFSVVEKQLVTSGITAHINAIERAIQQMRVDALMESKVIF